MIFYLGVHHPSWLATAGAPLMVSARWLRRRRSLPVAIAPWVLDSGAFTEIRLHGTWTVPATQYASEVRHWRDRIGHMAWAAPQDWMCEPEMVARTGLSVREHQRQTVANYLLLRQLAPDLPWIPVLQGYTLIEYRDCIYRYTDAGIALPSCPVVGVGSVCRRQSTSEVEEILHFIRGWGIRPHAFGLKLLGLRRLTRVLESSDSMAWSLDARHVAPLEGCSHRSCANCLRYALHWRGRVLDEVARANNRPLQGRLNLDMAEKR